MKHYNFDKVAVVYDNTRKVPDEIIARFKEEIRAFLRRNYKEDSYRVLSLGLGSGRIESHLPTPNLQLFGIDISKLMIEEFRKKSTTYPSFVSIADACSLPFRKHFHAIVAIHVVHLINRIQEFVDEIMRVSEALAVGGVYTDFYNHPIYEYYLTCLQKLGWISQPRGSSTVEFVELLQTKGYKIEERKTSLPTNQISSEVYDSIKNRYPSSLWDVPDSVHFKAIANLDEAIAKKELLFEENYQTLSHLNLFFALCEE